MNAFNKVLSTVSEAFEFNQATFSGSVDVIVVRQKDGTYKGTGFHARFGKVHAIKSKDRTIRIEINDTPTNVTMKLGEGGEAYFEEEVIDSNENELFEEFPDQRENLASLENLLYISGKPTSKMTGSQTRSPTGSESFKSIDNIRSPRDKIVINNQEQTNRKNKDFFSSIFGVFSKDKKEKAGLKVERIVTSRLTDNISRKDLIAPTENNAENENEIYTEAQEDVSSPSQVDIKDLVRDKNMDKNDVETAQKILSQISNDVTIKIAVYNNPIDGLTSDQIESIFETYMLPWAEFVEGPKKYLSNEALVIYVNGILYGHKIASFILAIFFNDFKKISNSSSSKKSTPNKAEVNVQSDSDKENSTLTNTNQMSSRKRPTTTTRVRKSLRLSSEKIKLLNLKPGQNTITYILNTGLQGTQKLQANVYLWSYNSKVIVTDVDGTLTKSDVLGAILPILGKDWTQPGIAPLFANIHRNGYHIIYLTSRAIGQIGFTRDFVKSVCQDGKKLPEGPIISSPDQLLPCFKREIVFSKPEYFKAAALRDIRNLFPPEHNPFHAGFGNRENDAVAYRFVGIPLENIFTVNGNGEVHHAAHKLYNSYAYLNAKVKEVFPCINSCLSSATH